MCCYNKPYYKDPIDLEIVVKSKSNSPYFLSSTYPQSIIGDNSNLEQNHFIPIFN